MRGEADEGRRSYSIARHENTLRRRETTYVKMLSSSEERRHMHMRSGRQAKRR
jgi:hypothetical protein